LVPSPWSKGLGAGTVIRFQMTLLGRTDDCHSVITEPEPGRVMVETETIRNTVTTFTVDPRVLAIIGKRILLNTCRGGLCGGQAA
jgi:hypothetical protein